MSEADVDTLIERYIAARERYESAASAVAEIGESRLERLAHRVDKAERTLETYADRATGSGDFRGYIAFRGEISSFVDGLPESALHREAFEELEEIVDKRRLSSADFEKAQDALSDPRDEIRALEERDEVRAEFRERERDVHDRLAALEERRSELDRVVKLGEADLDAPVGEIRQPIEAYNDAVTAAFRDFQRDAPASDVLSLYALTDRYPLVPMRGPPPGLRSYVEREFEDETITRLLEYATYSRSKLAHYVSDPDAFKAAVATERTYLERLDASPFRIPWPPPPAARLRWLVRELIPVVGRFASAPVIARLRTVRQLTHDAQDFDRLRAAAEAREGLSPTQRERLMTGELAEELAWIEDAIDRLRAILEDAPTP